MDHKGLRKVIVDDLKAGSLRTEEIIKSAKVDQKDFKSIMKSLDIFNRPTYHPTFTNDDIKNSTNKNKFPRYIREKETKIVVTPMHTHSNFLSHPEVTNSISKVKVKGKDLLIEFVNKFVKGHIDAKTFETSLKETNVNPEIEEIKKHIKSSETGPVKYKELMFSVMKYKNEE